MTESYDQAAGLAGQMEADVLLERAVAFASGCLLLGMRLYALELCSVYIDCD